LSAAAPTGSGRGRLSIGEVLNRLRPEFPDVSISKIRFLESEGLIDPERTPSGYRKFSYADVDRLRKVIKEHLEAMARGLEPPAVAGESPRAPRVVHAVPDELDSSDFGPAPPAELRMSADELIASSGLTATQVDELVSFGLLKTRPGTQYFDADALSVATTVAQLSAFGLEPRHIRAFKAAADREVGLIDQIVSPLARQRDDQARARADEMIAELGALSVRLHAALVKIGLRSTR
jgi:hypothetical protein